MQSFGFRYNELHSAETGLSVINVNRPLLPPIQSKTMVIPDRHGTLYFGYQYDPLEIQIEVALVGDDLLTFSGMKRRIAQWLSPEDGLQELIFDDEPDKKYNAVLKDTTELEQVLSMGRGELTFLVPDPFAYAVLDDIFTYTEQGTYQFERQGTENSYPFIEIEGECSPSGKLILSLNQSTLAFSGQLSAGDTLILDSELITAKIRKADGHVVSAINLINSLDFPLAIPGENTLDIQATGGAVLTALKITCRSRWK